MFLQKYFLENYSYADIGKEAGISRERVRVVLAQGLGRLYQVSEQILEYDRQMPHERYDGSSSFLRRHASREDEHAFVSALLHAL